MSALAATQGANVDNCVYNQHDVRPTGGFSHLLSQTSKPTVRNKERAVTQGGPSNMARTRRRRGGVPTAVKRTVRRVRTTARRRAPAAGGDLMKAVQSLVKALPVSELEKRLAGLEKTVARLEAGLRGAARRAGSAVRGKRTAKRKTAKRATAKRTAKRTTARRGTRRR